MSDKTVDEWRWHEAMDRAACLETMFHTLIEGLPVMDADPEIRLLAENAGEVLGNLYQRIAARRFDLFPAAEDVAEKKLTDGG
jgi:hypothetical protein